MDRACRLRIGPISSHPACVHANETTALTEFAAILLVCLASLPPERCVEASAVEMRSIVVGNELGCTQGWQELIAREPQASGRAGLPQDGVPTDQAEASGIRIVVYRASHD